MESKPGGVTALALTPWLCTRGCAVAAEPQNARIAWPATQFSAQRGDARRHHDRPQDFEDCSATTFGPTVQARHGAQDELATRNDRERGLPRTGQLHALHARKSRKLDFNASFRARFHGSCGEPERDSFDGRDAQRLSPVLAARVCRAFARIRCVYVNGVFWRHQIHVEFIESSTSTTGSAIATATCTSALSALRRRPDGPNRARTCHSGDETNRKRRE
jgi:hypothetical protein